MNEVEKCLHYAKWPETRARILKSIVNNKLSKPHCREIAKQYLDAKILYKPQLHD